MSLSAIPPRASPVHENIFYNTNTYSEAGGWKHAQAQFCVTTLHLMVLQRQSSEFNFIQKQDAVNIRDLVCNEETVRNRSKKWQIIKTMRRFWQTIIQHNIVDKPCHNFAFLHQADKNTSQE